MNTFLGIAKGERPPRVWYLASYGEGWNEIFHIDFPYIENANKGDLKYISVVIDDFSLYSLLHNCDTADSEAATIALCLWIACLGKMKWAVSYQGPHFTASPMIRLTECAHVRHHITAERSPWPNRTAGRFGKGEICAIKPSNWRGGSHHENDRHFSNLCSVFPCISTWTIWKKK